MIDFTWSYTVTKPDWCDTWFQPTHGGYYHVKGQEISLDDLLNSEFYTIFANKGQVVGVHYIDSYGTKFFVSMKNTTKSTTKRLHFTRTFPNETQKRWVRVEDDRKFYVLDAMSYDAKMEHFINAVEYESGRQVVEYRDERAVKWVNAKDFGAKGDVMRIDGKTESSENCEKAVGEDYICKFLRDTETHSGAPFPVEDEFDIHEISTEMSRTYHYANGVTLTIEDPVDLWIKKSNTKSHRITTAYATVYKPSNDWIGISWEPTEISDPVLF